jgi:hypothetical protein
VVLGLPVAGLATLAIVAAFIVTVYRMSGIRYTPLERRRMR